MWSSLSSVDLVTELTARGVAFGNWDLVFMLVASLIALGLIMYLLENVGGLVALWYGDAVVKMDAAKVEMNQKSAIYKTDKVVVFDDGTAPQGQVEEGHVTSDSATRTEYQLKSKKLGGRRTMTHVKNQRTRVWRGKVGPVA